MALEPVFAPQLQRASAMTAGALLPGRREEWRRCLLVIAEAGSGKTHTVAHLIVQGPDPRRTLLMTSCQSQSTTATASISISHSGAVQRNFTDPESRIMKSKDGFVQAYNAQAAVDAGAQIIVAHELTQCGSDQGQLVPLVEAIENNLGRKPEQASADSGYCSEANLEALEAHGIDGYVAPGRAKHPTAANGKVGGPLTQRMRKKIDDGGFETPYRLRKQVVEPVFGQIKQARGFRQFLLRGVEKLRAEWAMICTAHNLLKLCTLANAA